MEFLSFILSLFSLSGWDFLKLKSLKFVKILIFFFCIYESKPYRVFGFQFSIEMQTPNRYGIAEKIVSVVFTCAILEGTHSIALAIRQLRNTWYVYDQSEWKCFREENTDMSMPYASGALNHFSAEFSTKMCCVSDFSEWRLFIVLFRKVEKHYIFFGRSFFWEHVCVFVVTNKLVSLKLLGFNFISKFIRKDSKDSDVWMCNKQHFKQKFYVTFVVEKIRGFHSINLWFHNTINIVNIKLSFQFKLDKRFEHQPNTECWE